MLFLGTFTCENFTESCFNIGGAQRWCLHEHQTFLFWIAPGFEKQKNINTEQNVFSSENTIYENFCKT